jgi:hypothetical protein
MIYEILQPAELQSFIQCTGSLLENVVFHDNKTLWPIGLLLNMLWVYLIIKKKIKIQHTCSSRSRIISSFDLNVSLSLYETQHSIITNDARNFEKINETINDTHHLFTAVKQIIYIKH